MLALKAVFTALFIVAALTFCAALVYANNAPALAPAPVLSPDEYHALSKNVDSAFKSSTSSLNLQTEVPVKKEVQIQKKDRNRLLFSISPAVARIFLIVAIIVIVVIILLNFKNNRWSDSRARELKRKNEIEIDTEATVVRMEKAQLEADELARLGNFAEAMHVLLLQSVNELRQRLKVSIAVSLTSREILHRIGLPPEGHNVFADIIRRVEISYFGHYQPVAEDYAACRVSYDTLTDILGKGGTAA